MEGTVMDEIDNLRAENQALRTRLSRYEVGDLPNLRNPDLDERAVNDQLRTLIRQVERGL
jgi:hypothetical protein